MKNILIIGVGGFGKNLADKLLELKNEVKLIDCDEDVIERLSEDYEDVLIGDCRNMNVIKQLGIKDFDICVVSVGGNFQASLEITSNLKEAGAKYIISQCQSDIQTKFLRMAGADKTIYAEKAAAEKTAFMCNEDKLIDYISISKDVKIVKVHVPEDWAGHTLPELHLRDKYGINVLAVEKGDAISVPTPMYSFCCEDNVLLLGEEQKLLGFLKK